MSLERTEWLAAMEPPFLKLPLEIRQQIYRMLVPSQDSPVRSNQWSNLVESPNDYLQLTRVNRQISDEAREVLYSCTASTIVVSDLTTNFLGCCQFSESHTFLLESVPRMRPVRYMKHWQLSILFQDDGWGDSEAVIDSEIEPALRAMSTELVKVRGLQTLKISVPCLCYGRESITKNILQESACERVRRNLEPLRQLRFKCKVVFITAQRWRPWEDAVKAYETANPEPSPLNREAWLKWNSGRPKYWFPSYSEEVDHAVRSDANGQCPEAACVAFAKSFNDMKATIEGAAPSDPLTSHRKTWLELRDCAMMLLPLCDSYIHHYALDPTWRAVLSVSESRFDERRFNQRRFDRRRFDEKCLDQRCFNEKRFEEIARTAKQILDARLKYLRSSGRLDQFFKFQAEGIPEILWEKRFKSAKVDVDDWIEHDLQWQMERLTYSMREIADVALESTRHQREMAEEAAETNTLMEDPTASATENDAEEDWPAKDWWVQKTAVSTAPLEAHQAETAQAENATAEATSEYTTASATENDAAEDWPAKDWWVQKTAVSTPPVEAHHAETAQAENATAEDASDLTVPGAYDDNEEDDRCIIS
ncbi:MAG: hypothetical protein LQ348_005153 [Seirophora lacunosa]|nr:MAG: hypothetical protein LQ348_005153 [Seirophora lacunosa]